jgi:hypothetical protein
MYLEYGRVYPSRTWGPREMFSWAGRALGGAMVAADAVLLLERLALGCGCGGCSVLSGSLRIYLFSQIRCVLM